MIHITASNKMAYEIVQKAFTRSHGNIVSHNDTNIYCFISPNAEDEETISKLILNQTKVLIFGKISENLAEILGLELQVNKMKLADITFDHDNEEDKSAYKIRYDLEHPLCKHTSLEERYFYRFDFTNEWNNLGYGAITTDDGIWSVSNSLNALNTTSIATIYKASEEESVFISLKDFESASVLFVNREIGTIDGLDWVIVEDFLSRYRVDHLPCLPLVCDIPDGYNLVASSRLDCDQSIINTKPVVDLYKKYNINISLGISTGINIDTTDIEHLNTFYDNGGAVLSHTINHHEYWGENYTVAYDEAQGSKLWLEENIIHLEKLKYAVSPFHSNKPYSIQALQDAGYEGFISGIIHNDPEYLMATSGVVPFVKESIITHSEQCMLHGDCYHRNNNSLEVYKQSFQNHYRGKKIFGYLDHPFGDYDYGWKSEEERLSVHEAFIKYINTFEGVKWMTSTEILDFVVDKSSIQLEITSEDELVCKRHSFNSSETINIHYKNRVYTC
ncbi:MAG: hypothetical protein GQ531_02015 [Sulfurovum sp.]|nr:hypothetical protein [Sulfurovum sp.]